MATYTTNLDLKKPATSDKIRIADINNNMDTIDEAVGDIGDTDVATQLGDIRGGMAIVSTGNTHDAISAGQFVYVMGHDTLDDGLYTANSALAANATLSSSNVTAVSGGGLNALNSNIANPTSYTLTGATGVTVEGYECKKLGKLVIGNVRFTTSATISASTVLINGLPHGETTLSGTSSFGVCPSNKTDKTFLLSNDNANNARIVNGASLSADTYILSFCYISDK